MAATDPRPRGREEIVDALVAAARRLFGARGPDAVSLRQVAAEAGVNYGLVYQYIGTKEELIRVVYRSASEQAAQTLAATADLGQALGTLRANASAGTYARMLAWTLLQGHDPREFLGRSAAMAEVVRRAATALDGGPGEGATAEGADATADDETARLLTAVAMSINLGTQVFADFFAVAVGLEGGAPEVHAAVDRVLAALPALLAEAGREPPRPAGGDGPGPP